MLEIKEDLSQFKEYLISQERSEATIKKYLHDVSLLAEYTKGILNSKKQLIDFKEWLLAKGYAVSSINSMLAAINQFLCFKDRPEWKLHFLKVQRTTFSHKKKELTREEYERIVETAIRQRNDQLAMLLQTICATGIRVSELKGITVEAVRRGYGQILSKGKLRQILFPKELCKMLQAYCRLKNIKSGCIFITRGGRPLDRSNIWRMMKRVAKSAHVKPQKVFPHNLRHLFACAYYSQYKDIVRLADILGHSSVDTTRIYTSRSGDEQQQQMNDLHLVIQMAIPGQ